MPKKEILSFAECLAKLDRVRKDLTPEMIDVATQTDITMAEIKQMEQDGGDLKEAIKNYVPLTIYKKETELRLKDLNNTLKTYEQTHIYLKTQAKKDKNLIDNLEEEVKKGNLTEEQLIVKIRELEKKLVKPLMVTVATETKLTMAEIAKMEAEKQSLKVFLDKSDLIKDEDKKKDILFRLEIVERGIASLEEDREHNIENGRAMAEQMGKLEEDVRMGRIIENDLESRVKSLEGLLKRKESEYQQELKVKDEDWNKLDEQFKEIKKLYGEKDEVLVQANKDKEELNIQIGEKNKELEKLNKDVEDGKAELERGRNNMNFFLDKINELNDKKNKLSDYELNEILPKIQSAFSILYFSIYRMSSFSAGVIEEESLKAIKEMKEIVSFLEKKWEVDKTPVLSQIFFKEGILNGKRFFIESFEEVMPAVCAYNLRVEKIRELEAIKDGLVSQVEERDRIIEEKQEALKDLNLAINGVKNELKDRVEDLRLMGEAKERFEAESKEAKKSFQDVSAELTQFSKHFSERESRFNEEMVRIKAELDRRRVEMREDDKKAIWLSIYRGVRTYSFISPYSAYLKKHKEIPSHFFEQHGINLPWYGGSIDNVSNFEPGDYYLNSPKAGNLPMSSGFFCSPAHLGSFKSGQKIRFIFPGDFGFSSFEVIEKKPVYRSAFLLVTRPKPIPSLGIVEPEITVENNRTVITYKRP